MIREFRMGEQLCDEMIMIAQVKERERQTISTRSIQYCLELYSFPLQSSLSFPVVRFCLSTLSTSLINKGKKRKSTCLFNMSWLWREKQTRVNNWGLSPFLHLSNLHSIVHFISLSFHSSPSPKGDLTDWLLDVWLLFMQVFLASCLLWWQTGKKVAFPSSPLLFFNQGTSTSPFHLSSLLTIDCLVCRKGKKVEAPIDHHRNNTSTTW